ncbi:putative kinase [Actinokineospora baliensis]|uniref:ATP-binding protein n=1 Tax=Actinokineospora baliensis TaxID=547056 RepID=UPI00195D2735|nr:ATP-binding protein [Actinokineospora baliensis]MBM7774078.1 putative kinase [Actinokineospora baliensis]
MTAPAPYLDPLWARLPALRCVVLVGLPGTGKSLLVRELAAAAIGRRTGVLQWDVARRSWDQDPVARDKYPEIDGVTHAGVRVAMGSWVRSAVADWFTDDGLLIVEAPLIGGRFAELAHRLDDDAEAVLAAHSTLFTVLAPEDQLREQLRGQRSADMSEAGDDHLERHNASVKLLDELTDSLRTPAAEQGVTARTDSGYDQDLYVALMEKVLKHRHTTVIRPDSLMAVSGSVYALDDRAERVWPNPQQVHRSIAESEALSATALSDRVESWYRT